MRDPDPTKSDPSRWKWTHSRFPSVDQDHRPEKKSSSFGLLTCRHCGQYIAERAKAAESLDASS